MFGAFTEAVLDLEKQGKVDGEINTLSADFGSKIVDVKQCGSVNKTVFIHTAKQFVHVWQPQADAWKRLDEVLIQHGLDSKTDKIVSVV